MNLSTFFPAGLTAELMEANSEHQPLVNGEPGIHTTQPSPLLPDAAGHQQAFPGSKVDSSIQMWGLITSTLN